MNKNSAANTNCLKVSEDVIAKIAEIAVGDIKGVCGFTKAKIDFVNLFVKSERQPAIDIKTNGDSVEISLSIIVSENCKVKSVAEKVQQRVKDEIQNMTGIAVTKVNVRIEGIVFDNE